MPTPGRRLGDNFRCEMEHILQSGKRQKTIVVGPPDLDETTRQATYETYRLLGWPSVKHVHLSAHDGTDGRLVVHPSVGADDPMLGGRYQRAIETAIQEVIARP